MSNSKQNRGTPLNKNTYKQEVCEEMDKVRTRDLFKSSLLPENWSGTFRISFLLLQAQLQGQT